MNQWIGAMTEPEDSDIYRPTAVAAIRGDRSTGGASTMLAMLLGSRFLKPSLLDPPEHNAIEAQLVEVIPPPKPAGLQGGAAPVAIKPKTVERPHPQHKTVVAHRPKIETPPPIAASETSAVGSGPAVPTIPVASGKEAGVGVPGGAGVGSGAGTRQRCLGCARDLRAYADDSRRSA